MDIHPSTHTHVPEMIGTDILSLKRLKGVLARFPRRIVDKLLSEPEKKQFQLLGSDRRRLEFLGGRFCGKEAIFKAADLAALTWKRVSILPPPGMKGRPRVFIDGNLAEEMEISISHEEEFVVATAICFRIGMGREGRNRKDNKALLE